MPYFVYRVETAENGKKKLTHLETFSDYKTARSLARDKRAEAGDSDNGEFRMIFAKNEIEAETLLSTPRDERVIGED